MAMKGKVKFIDEDKGFGFIKPADAGDDIFVHSSGILHDIYENDPVEFEVKQDRRGMTAVNVRVIKK
jgi:CspA family cold shock protein